MKRHLEKLRSQPDHRKEKIVKTLSLGVTIGIAIVYIIIRSFEFTQQAQTNNEPSDESLFLQTFENGFNQIGTAVNDISGKFSNERESFTELLEAEAIKIETDQSTETELSISDNTN